MAEGRCGNALQTQVNSIACSCIRCKPRLEADGPYKEPWGTQGYVLEIMYDPSFVIIG